MDVEEIKHWALYLPKTSDQITKLLQEDYPGKSGYTGRSGRRFCQEQGISRRSELDQNALDQFCSGKGQPCRSLLRAKNYDWPADG